MIVIKLAEVIEFEAKIAKHKRINVPTRLYTVKEGKKYYVRLTPADEQKEEA